MGEAPVEFLIVGGGIAGLFCGTELTRAGRGVRILDKGRGYGGRMATRRMGGGRLDHGAQYFTVRDERFGAYVAEWLEAGILREWFRHLPEDSNPAGYPRYRGANGMTDVPKYLGSGLDVRRSERVERLRRRGAFWEAETGSGARHLGRELILALPPPQALALLDAGVKDVPGGCGDRWAALRAVRYEKGLATLVLLDGPSGVPGPGGMKVDKGPLSWIADNEQKGISPGIPAVTLHAGADFAESHWESPDDVRGPKMVEAARPYLGAGVREFACHRWGFSRPVRAYGRGDERYHRDAECSLTFVGDAFGGGRVEGAALSGMAAALELGVDAGRNPVR